MKSMFSMGFFSNDVFRPAGGGAYLGQVTLDLSSYLASVTDAIGKFGQINSWIQANPNYNQLLGTQATNFQNYMNLANNDSITAGNVQATLQGADPSQPQAPITQDDKNVTDAFISEVGQMIGMINTAATGGATPTPSGGATPVGASGIPGSTANSNPSIPNLISQLLPTSKPPVKPGTLPAPAASPISTPLLVGGGILALGLVVLLVKRG